ncbi:DUF2262 domain-containing protein [Acidovorax sp. 106]|uniref:DUF2262 domain-containing protein n=1 Tax=Acidovorax sp. 106 TaxID=2135637 RepID=UPI00131485E7|nr:DUF2262 domain-containing protein [Acidovorax sp. 106]
MIVASDTVLGDVERDENGLHSVKVRWGNKDISTHLMVERHGDPSTCISVARELVQHLDLHVPSARSVAAHDLVELANDWRESDDSPELDASDLHELFEFDALLVFEDGTIEFCFTDGDVFAGHAVIVDRAPDGTFSNARFEG